MGLDIYAGTLTRYYSGNWKTAVQQWAEENGYDFSLLTPQGERIQQELPDPDEVRSAVQDWQANVLEAVLPGQGRWVAWPEDNERPYYTDKPDWDAFGALLLYAACKIGNEPLPPTVDKGWAYYDHPVIQSFAKEQEQPYSLFLGAQLWLPLEEALLFRCQSPAGEEKTVSTTGALRLELEQINRAGWQAGEEEIVSWSECEGYPTDGQVENGEIVRLGQETRFDTESLAKFAFSMLYQAVCFSGEYRVPILLDY